MSLRTGKLITIHWPQIGEPVLEYRKFLIACSMKGFLQEGGAGERHPRRPSSAPGPVFFPPLLTAAKGDGNVFVPVTKKAARLTTEQCLTHGHWVQSCRVSV